MKWNETLYYLTDRYVTFFREIKRKNFDFTNFFFFQVFLLQDRLFHGSDKTRVKVCIGCGSLLSPRVTLTQGNHKNTNRFREYTTKCVVCPKEKASVRDLSVPYIFLHLISQLAAVNIKIKIDTKYE